MSKEQQLIVVANRLPVRNVQDEKGQRWETSPGGLVAALAPVIGERPNASWVGWTGTAGRSHEPFELDGLQLHPVELSRADVQLYYEGFSNGTIWPLYHDAIVAPAFHRTWWDAYVKVNQRFADQVLAMAKPDATVWVHDYQLQLLPGMLRKAMPSLRIGFFFHIPFPARELFLRLPWRAEIVRSLLASDVIGFHTDVMAHNFRHVVPRLIDADDLEVGDEEILCDGHRTLALTHPIGIDYERFANAADTRDIGEAVARHRETLGNPKTILLGVDRLDYTKGIERRLRAFGELLEEDRVHAEDAVLIQIAEPSRTNVDGYAEIRSSVEQRVGEINGKFASMMRPAVHYMHRGHSFEELMPFYCLADVMLVTPFRDGMNLVAKEYVASRRDCSGSLVLSEFAGAAHELEDALLVNPYDIEGLKTSIEAAVFMAPEEQRRRMRTMRATVAHNTAQHWAETFLERLESQ